MDSIKITDIVIENRHRKDFGDLEALASSIELQGLLQPIGLTQDLELVFGERRIRAFQLLGREEIPYRIVNVSSIVEGEHDENELRKDFSFDERVEIGRSIEKMFGERRGRSNVENFPHLHGVKTRDIAASKAGFGNARTYEQAKEIVDSGSESLINAVKAGEASIFSGSALSSLPQDEQDEIIARGEVEILRAAKAIRQKRYAELQSKRDILPDPAPISERQPLMICSSAESLPIGDETVDLIITSPPYNLGHDEWTLNGATPRPKGIGYEDDMEESEYQELQLKCLSEMYRVSRPGASLFYNHKCKQREGACIHPLDWLLRPENPWTLRQEIVWDRGSTHNHQPKLFWGEDERIYWFTKGKPTLPNRPIAQSTVWRFPFESNTLHPAPFPEELPERCIKAVGRPGITVLDPFAGSGTTIAVALRYGYEAIYNDISPHYNELARRLHGWKTQQRTSKDLRRETNLSTGTR